MHRTATVADEEIQALLAHLDEGRQAWIDGLLGFGRGLDVDQDDDMTIFGPFGGEALRGTAASGPQIAPKLVQRRSREIRGRQDHRGR